MIAAILVTIAAVASGAFAGAMCGAWQRLVRRMDTVDQRMEFLCDRIERLERKS